jgi:hypothetical protein
MQAAKNAVTTCLIGSVMSLTKVAVLAGWRE